MNEDNSRAIKKTVSLDPFVERMIRQYEAEMLKSGRRNANFSLSLNILVLSMFFDHACNGESLHRKTAEMVRQWLKGELYLNDKEFAKWEKWIEKVATQPEASVDSGE